MTTTTNTNVPIKRFGSDVLGTAPVTTYIRNIEMETSIATFGISLPAGRWLTKVGITQVPSTDSYPFFWSSDNTLASPGTVTVPALGPQWCHLDVGYPTNRRDVQVDITVSRWNGTAWKPYASSASTIITGSTPHAAGAKLWGVNSHPFAIGDNAARTVPLIDRASELGVDVMRFSVVTAIGWQSNQTFTAAWLAEVDALMAEVSAKGLKALLSLSLNAVPSWYTGTSGTYAYNTGTISGSYKVAREGTTGIWSQSDISAIIATLATRYGTDIYGYEGQNEPDATNSIMTASDQVLYVRRIKTGIAASSQTGAKAISGPLTQGNFSYFDDMITAGLVDADFDLFGLHAYHVRFAAFTPHVYSARIPMSDDYSQSIAGMERFRDHYLAAGLTKNFALTEYGVSSTTLAGWVRTEAQQANDIRFMTKQVASIPYVDLGMIHTMEEKATSPGAWLNRFGLVRYSRLKDYKPAFVTVQSTLAALP